MVQERGLGVEVDLELSEHQWSAFSKHLMLAMWTFKFVLTPFLLCCDEKKSEMSE